MVYIGIDFNRNTIPIAFDGILAGVCVLQKNHRSILHSSRDESAETTERFFRRLEIFYIQTHVDTFPWRQRDEFIYDFD